MKSQSSFHKYAVGSALAAAVILLIPLLAMQFSDDVIWGWFDFGVAWTLLFGAGLTYKLAAEKLVGFPFRAAVGVAVATALFLIWSNLAVGLIGSENNPANLMYLGVLAILIAGTFIANFQPHKMVFALFATAAAQMLVAIIALLAGMHHLPDSSVAEIFGVNGFFTVLWSGSALLFRYAEQKPAKS